MRLCALTEIADPGGKSFRFREGSRMFAGFVVRQGGAVTGFVDSCPHAGWPLAQLDDRYLTRDARQVLSARACALYLHDSAAATLRFASLTSAAVSGGRSPRAGFTMVPMIGRP